MSDNLVVLCDVMDTLVYNPFNCEIPGFFGMSQAELLAQKHATSWIEFEHGEIDEAEYLRRCFADYRHFDHQEFLRVVRQSYRWIEGVEEILHELTRRGFEINALSNYPIWYRTIEDQLRLSRYLNWKFVSCETGIRKPDPEAFLTAASAVNRSPQECLFIDDSLINCRAAEDTGMPAIHFQNAAALRAELRDRGLLS